MMDDVVFVGYITPELIRSVTQGQDLKDVRELRLRFPKASNKKIKVLYVCVHKN